MTHRLVEHITSNQAWTGLAVLVLVAVAVALIVLSYTAWSARND
ncbi:hypothetical protein ACGFZP_12785 [Kitasatospora sp. NPDC048239]